MSWFSRASDRALTAVGIMPAIKGTDIDTLRFGGVSHHDRDNFTTNRITEVEYQDRLARSGNPAGLSATWACVNLIAGSAASLSPMVLRPGPDGVRSEFAQHPLAGILGRDPNFDQSAFDFWEFIFASVELQGNAYAQIQRNGVGTVVALTPLRPDIVKVRRRSDGELEYEWTVDGEPHQHRQRDVFHVRGFGGGPLGGLSTLAVCGLAFGGALAAERSAAAMFANGARPSGVLSTDEKFSPEQRALVEGLLAEKFSGSMKSGRPMLLDNKLQWQQLTINPDDAQLLESRKYGGEEICRIFGVPPAMVGFGDKSSNWGTGKEVDVLGFVKFTLRKRLRRVEAAASKQLLTRSERDAGIGIKFNIEDLLRGDSDGRSQFYERMTRSGVMTRNEARKLENLPPVPGGDVPMVQMQDVPLTTAIENGGAKAFGHKRSLKVRDFALEIKADGVGDDGSFGGYGSVFGVVDSYKEIVAPGAFADSIADLAAKKRTVPVLWQHRSDTPIGVYDAIEEDETGLRVEGRLLIDGVGQAREAHALLKAGAVTGLSIGYWVRESSFDEKTGIRTLTKLDLVEVSLVTFPACDDARVEAVKFKLAHGELPDVREFEKLLREAGFSKSQSKVVACHGLPELLRREAEGDAEAKAGVEALGTAIADFALPQL